MEKEKVVKQCPYCGEYIGMNAKKCKYCGEWLTGTPATHQPQETIYRTNGAGLAGFVIGIICICFTLINISEDNEIGLIIIFNNFFNKILFSLISAGMLLSIIGIFFRPREWAIAGFLISIINLVIFMLLYSG